MAVALLYFGALRAALGCDGEEVSPPPEVASLGDLIDWLAARGEPYASALADRSRLRGAVDQGFVAMATPIAGAREIALFPPVTGG